MRDSSRNRLYQWKPSPTCSAGELRGPLLGSPQGRGLVKTSTWLRRGSRFGVRFPQELRLLVFREKRRADRVLAYLDDLPSREGERARSPAHLFVETRAEHCRVVRVQRDQQAGLEEPRQGMVLEPFEQAGRDVAGRTDFERNPPLADERHDLRIAEKRETVPDALGPEQLDRGADALGPDSFAGVRGHVQAQVSSLAINVSEEFGGAARFIAPDSKSHDALRAEATRPLEDLPGVIRAELADGIKNPSNAHSQPPLGLARSGGNRLEDRLDRLLLPEDNSSR